MQRQARSLWRLLSSHGRRKGRYTFLSGRNRFLSGGKYSFTYINDKTSGKIIGECVKHRCTTVIYPHIHCGDSGLERLAPNHRIPYPNIRAGRKRNFYLHAEKLQLSA